VLTTQDYDRVLDVVADCGGAEDLNGFSALLVEALAHRWGYRAVTACQGASLASALGEASPITSGLGTRLVEGYHERYGQGNVLRSPQATAALMQGRSVLTTELDRRSLGPAHQDYLDGFLLPHGVRSQLACYVGEPTSPGVLVILSDADAEAFGPRDRAVWSKLRRPLAAVARTRRSGPLTVAGFEQATGSPLTAREREVAILARTGRTNRAIARTLGITEDTVKQHMTRVMAKTGVQSRTQLAALPGLPRT
jgi:DNA-binding CsgD family transcriptional regulator